MNKQRLILVRHGITTVGLTPTFLGHTDVPLSDEGRAQAAQTREFLKDHRFTACYSSALSRTKETAAILCDGLHPTPIPDAAFNEIMLGDWDGLTFEQAKERYPETFAKRTDHTARFEIPNAETFEELQQRVMTGLESLVEKHPEGDLLVVAHAGVLRSVICHILQIPLDFQFRFYPRYAGVSVVVRGHADPFRHATETPFSVEGININLFDEIPEG